MGTTPPTGIQEASLAPYHVRHGKVHQQGPKHREQQHGAELHAFGKRAGDQRRRDNGEHQLIDHEGLLRDGGGIIGIGRGAHAMQEQCARSRR